MIKSINVNNFGPIKKIEWQKLGKINVIIGINGSGKTHLLKALYCSMKSIEQYQRGKSQKKIGELLADKLYWTFQPNQIGDIVSRGEKELSLCIQSSKGEELTFQYGSSTTRLITNISNNFSKKNSNSIFLPAKEVLSLQNIILESRSDKFNDFGFDDTYYDLAKAVTPTGRGKNVKAFSEARCSLSTAIKGRIEFNPQTKEWFFKDKTNKVFSVSLTSEGIKKLSIIDALLGNHYLSKDSIIFIDEPESALHPQLVAEFMKIILELSKVGIQFFIATHSFFVIKKLYIIAHSQEVSIPIISLTDDKPIISDLKVEMPENPIIREALNIYDEEIDL